MADPVYTRRGNRVFVDLDITGTGCSDPQTIDLSAYADDCRDGVVGVQEFGATLVTAGSTATLTPTVSEVSTASPAAERCVELATNSTSGVYREAGTLARPKLLKLGGMLAYLRWGPDASNGSTRCTARVVLDLTP